MSAAELVLLQHRVFHDEVQRWLEKDYPIRRALSQVARRHDISVKTVCRAYYRTKNFPACYSDEALSTMRELVEREQVAILKETPPQMAEVIDLTEARRQRHRQEEIG